MAPVRPSRNRGEQSNGQHVQPQSGSAGSDPAAHVIHLGERIRNLEFQIQEKEARIKNLKDAETQLKSDNAELGICICQILQHIRDTPSSTTPATDLQIPREVLQRLRGNEVFEREMREITVDDEEAGEANGDVDMTSGG